MLMLLAALACKPPSPDSADTQATGETGTGYHNPNGGCLSDNDCAGDVCDLDSGDCVQCTDDSHCSNPQPVCRGEVCVGCSSHLQCSNPAPICVISACEPCTSNEECRARGDDVCDQGACRGCDPNAVVSECPPEYPVCADSTCTVECVADPWESSEPVALLDIETDELRLGHVCPNDLTDRFQFTVLGPSYLVIEAAADPKPGDVDMTLFRGNTPIATSAAGTALDVIHATLVETAVYTIQVSWSGGALGVPYQLHARQLPF